MRYTDIQFTESEGGHWDLTIGDDGDFDKVNSFDTALYLSVYCERRASPSEVTVPQYRRGWIGNINLPVEYGSKLWLLYQARLTLSTVNKARDYLAQGLQWLIDFGYLKGITVNVSRSIADSSLTATISLMQFDGSVEHRNVTLWSNTGGN